MRTKGSIFPSHSHHPALNGVHQGCRTQVAVSLAEYSLMLLGTARLWPVSRCGISHSSRVSSCSRQRFLRNPLREPTLVDLSSMLSPCSCTLLAWCICHQPSLGYVDRSIWWIHTSHSKRSVLLSLVEGGDDHQLTADSFNQAMGHESFGHASAFK